MIKSQDLYETIRCGVKAVSWEELKKYSNILIIWKNDFEDKFEQIREVNQDAKLYRLIPSGMKQEKDLFADDKYITFEWKGMYTTEIIDMLEERGIIEELECFVFGGVMPIDLRNINLLEIAEKLDKNAGIPAFCIDSESDLYYYENVRVCCRGLELYMALDEYIDVCGKE